MDAKLVLIGMNWEPRRGTGDKNFWVQLLPYLARWFSYVYIISIRDSAAPSEQYSIGQCAVHVYYLRPIILNSPVVAQRKLRLWHQGEFPRFVGLLEKTVSTLRAVILARRIIKGDQRSQWIVHLMDNFGPANRLFAFVVPDRVKVTVSAVAYNRPSRIGRGIYHAFLRWSYNHCRLTTVACSEAYRDLLIDIGIPRSRVASVRWGVSGRSGGISRVEKSQSKELLGLPHKPLVLWAGYIQQIGRDSFLYAYRMAEELRSEGINCSFFFAFKPENYERAFSYLNLPERDIYVRPTTIEEFSALRQAADIFFSPIPPEKTTRVILAPPLTWLEMLADGVPVVTTNALGADETIVDGVNGAIASNDDDLKEKLRSFIRDCHRPHSQMERTVGNPDSLEAVALQYSRLWFCEEARG